MTTRLPDVLVPKLIADIVSAYVSKNSLSPTELPDLVDNVRGTLESLTSDTRDEIVFHVPAVPIDKSLQEDCIVCLEDGKKFKSLRRHLAIHHNMSPDQYRQKWQLPDTYPMAAPAFSDARSISARKSGLGRLQTKPRK